MTFPIELERLDNGLVFKLRDGKPIILGAKPLGDPFDMTFEDRPYGNASMYGGDPEERWGNFGEQIETEIESRKLTSEVANAYLALSPEREVSEKTIRYGDHAPVRRPRVAMKKIQLYSIDKDIAKNHRGFIAAFVNAWAR